MAIKLTKSKFKLALGVVWNIFHSPVSHGGDYASLQEKPKYGRSCLEIREPGGAFIQAIEGHGWPSPSAWMVSRAWRNDPPGSLVSSV